MKKIIMICLLLMLPIISYADEASKRENVEELLALMDADSII